MSTFWKSFVGAFLGRVFASIFIAVCVGLAIGPDRVATFMIQNLPIWITPEIARGAFLVLGLVTFLAVFKPWEWFRAKSVKGRRDQESVSLLDVMYWIDEKSAWGRWQKSMNGLLGESPVSGTRAQMQKWHWTSEVQSQAKDGKLPINARRGDSLEREDIRRDFWDIASIDVRPDDRSLWRISVVPKDGLGKAASDKIKKADYVDLRTTWDHVREIWPEHDRLTDRLTKEALQKINGNQGKRSNVELIGAPIIVAIIVFAAYQFVSSTERRGVPPSAIGEAFWAELTQSETEALVAELQKIPSYEVVISCDQSTCRPLARSIIAAFRQASWLQVKASIGGVDQIGLEGISIYPVDDRARNLREIIESKTNLNITLFGEERSANAYPAVFISIGQKPLE